jgi:hypothetical protein
MKQILIYVLASQQPKMAVFSEHGRKPFPSPITSSAEVAAVLALRRDVLVALENGGECCSTESDLQRYRIGGVALSN